MKKFGEIIKKGGEPQRIAITLKFKKKQEYYLLKDEELTSKYKSDTFENEFYKWVQIGESIHIMFYFFLEKD